MADHQIVIAGFGGQGLLFSGKVLAYAGLIEGRELSWLPSYGPEMRGGTANCNVILSDAPVGSPIVNTPNVLMVMNNPSLDKYENAVQPGGKIFLDSTLIARKVTRTDVEAYYVPGHEDGNGHGNADACQHDHARRADLEDRVCPGGEPRGRAAQGHPGTQGRPL